MCLWRVSFIGSSSFLCALTITKLRSKSVSGCLAALMAKETGWVFATGGGAVKKVCGAHTFCSSGRTRSLTGKQRRSFIHCANEIRVTAPIYLFFPRTFCRCQIFSIQARQAWLIGISGGWLINAPQKSVGQIVLQIRKGTQRTRVWFVNDKLKSGHLWIKNVRNWSYL